ncbi:uncharacterized protein LOC111053584 [Nilaparvata lugens]|uniref:uncharacterized protein LOC111053584 n=1 Tax=Nilaparvata lugens TaxID=108931 RepID=UPI00193E880E|nr:uncharacterized protein LOC111053584 [Nilaparvata lugens]
MEFFLVFKAYVIIYLISFPCRQVNGAIDYTEHKVVSRRDGNTVTIFVGKERHIIFNSRQEFPADLTKAVCFQLDEKAANSLPIDPMQFILFNEDNSENSMASYFSHQSTRIFSCQTEGLFVFLHVERTYKYDTAGNTAVKSIKYNSDVLKVQNVISRLPSCLASIPKSVEVREKTYREHGDIIKSSE